MHFLAAAGEKSQRKCSMAYSIALHEADLLWVTLQGQMDQSEAERYLAEIWKLLSRCPSPTCLLVDGRQIGKVTQAAQRRTDQVARHPHIGHIAFVVRQQHLLLFAPIVKLVSGIGMFGTENSALDYLRQVRGLPPVLDFSLHVDIPRPPEFDGDAPHHQHHVDSQPVYSSGSGDGSGKPDETDAFLEKFNEFADQMSEWGRFLDEFANKDMPDAPPLRRRR
jgi:hypothetical protein